MKIWLVYFSLVVLCWAQICFAQSTLPVGSSRANQIVRHNAVTQVTDNITFEFLNPAVENSPMFKIESKQSVRSDAEGSLGLIRMTAFAATGKKYNKPMWTIQDDSSEFGISGDLVSTTKRGCCGSSETKRYYSAANGQKLFSTTEPVLYVLFNNTRTYNTTSRWIGLIDNYASGDFPNLKASDLGYPIFVLSYASDTKVIDRILIRRLVSMAHDDNPGISQLSLDGVSKEFKLYPENNELAIWAQDPSDFTFGIKIHNECHAAKGAADFYFPISHDRISLKMATIPEGFHAEMLNEK